MKKPDDDRPLRTSEVAALFRVDPKTISKWIKEGKMPGFRTPGGHWRVLESEAYARLAPPPPPAPADPDKPSEPQPPQTPPGEWEDGPDRCPPGCVGCATQTHPTPD